jgi:hypothetical protein
LLDEDGQLLGIGFQTPLGCFIGGALVGQAAHQLLLGGSLLLQLVFLGCQLLQD